MLLSLMMVSLASAGPEMVVSNPNSASNGGQISPEEWTKTFGGSGDDAGTYCPQTRDGGYIIAGYDAIREGFVLMLLSLMMVSLASASPEMVVSNPNSTSYGSQIPREEWNRTFGGSGDDAGTYCQQTRDGGYIIVGYTSSYGVDAPYSWLIKAAQRGDIWLIKTNSKGEAEWERTFGGLGKDLGFSVQQTNDDGFIIVGGKKSLLIGNYHIWLIKTDSKGNTDWDRTFEGSGEDVGFSVQQTNDSGYIIAGYNSYSDGRRVWLIKTDPKGNKEWDVALGKKDSEASFVQQTKDGGYIVTGYTSAYGAGKEDVWLIKTDSKGSWEWLKTFGGPEKDVGFSVNETEDGGYIIAGVTESYGAGKGDVWLIKTDWKGNKEWDRTFGGAGFDAGTSVQQTRDGGYIITGCNTTFNTSNKGPFNFLNPDSLSRVYLIKTDSKGNLEWDEAFGGSRSDWGNCVQETQDGGYVITGVTKSYGAGKEDVWLIKVK